MSNDNDYLNLTISDHTICWVYIKGFIYLKEINRVGLCHLNVHLNKVEKVPFILTGATYTDFAVWWYTKHVFVSVQIETSPYCSTYMRTRGFLNEKKNTATLSFISIREAHCSFI